MKDKLAQQQDIWNGWAKIDPLYGILSAPGKTDGRWDIDEFFATGIWEIESAMTYIRNKGLKIGRSAALDFGCGVGRLTQALARHFDWSCGVDISLEMIKLARQHNQSNANVTYIHNPARDLRVFEDRQFDFIYSSYVLQHIPPEISLEYVKEFLRVLKMGGLLMFQFPSSILPMYRPWYWAKPFVPSFLLKWYHRAIAGTAAAVYGPPPMHRLSRSALAKLIVDSGGQIMDAREIKLARAHHKNHMYIIAHREMP